MLARLLKGLTAAACTKVALVMLLMANNVLLARTLTIEEFGKYAYFFSASILLGMLFQFGFDQVGLRRSAYLSLKSSPRSIWVLFRTFASYSLILSSPFFLIAAVLTVIEIELLLIFIWALLLCLQVIVGEFFRGIGKIGKAGLYGGLFANVLLAIFLLVLLALKVPFDLRLAVGATIGSLGINAVVAVATLRFNVVPHAKSLSEKIEPVGFVAALREGFPYLLNSVAFFGLSNADTLILAAYKPATEVGVYAAASKLALVIALPLQVINAAIPNFIAEARLRRSLERMQFLMRIAATGAAYPAATLVFAMIIFGADLLGSIYGSEFKSAHLPLVILTIGQFVNAWSGPAGRCLIMMDAGRYVLIAASTSTILGLAIAAVLAPILGAAGVATGVAVSIAVHNIAMWYFCKSKLNVNPSSLNPLAALSYARLLLERFAPQNNVFRAIEKSVRFVELVYWRATGHQVVDVYGDSHSRIMRVVHQRHKDLPFRFRTIGVNGATAFGMANPNSKTNALTVFRHWASSSTRSKITLCMIGEVDCGFLIWWRAQNTGADIRGLLATALHNYQGFLIEMSKKYEYVIVCAAPLPTIPDEGAEGEIAKFRSEVKAKQLARTELTLQFNGEMEKWCARQNFLYINMDKVSLDPVTGIVSRWLLNENRADHHYDATAFVRLLYPLLVNVAEAIRVRAAELKCER